MPEAIFYIMQGDTRTKLEFFVEKINGEPVDLTGTTVVAHMRVKPGGSITFQDRSVGIVNTATGECSLTLTTTDTATDDEYEFQVQITFSDGGIIRIPNDNTYLPVLIGDAIS